MDKMTKIDGKYYDLSKFNHPGGDVALSHTFGRDSTILFKSYHQTIYQQVVPNAASKSKMSCTLVASSPLISTEHPDVQPNSPRSTRMSATDITPSPLTSSGQAHDTNSQEPSLIVASTS